MKCRGNTCSNQRNYSREIEAVSQNVQQVHTHSCVPSVGLVLMVYYKWSKLSEHTKCIHVFMVSATVLYLNLSVLLSVKECKIKDNVEQELCLRSVCVRKHVSLIYLSIST